MITTILKQYIDGEWREVVKPMYQVGDLVRINNGSKYIVIQVSGSKITLEKINYLAKRARRGNKNE